MPSIVQTKSVLVDSGISVFYRTAGAADAPVVLLLHGYPTSSHQFRNLIPILATKYRVVAPDLPGFGFTTVPAERGYKYTFDALAGTITAFLDALSISSFAVYIFDYGAPVGLRIALARPHAVKAIVTQNGNAYEEGLGDAWAPIRAFWASNSEADRNTVRTALLNFEATKWQYTNGSRFPDAIAPESYTLDWALLQRPGNFEIQLDLFYDYQNNVKLYPKFQDMMCFFVPPGAEAFKRDVPNAEVVFLNAGHFAGETETKEVGERMLKFLENVL
ncbi:Alpha/beta hydrolase fold protein [Mycena chlorophos]|uniref:Alpha/beta hydrolase fold protein n=1 Tax=Mycena chlorophos TaxID=658473 RepID=A0A8H6SBF3_MYCCL|nr:Alpha/beta hydrolase fold protein [Mycena chlorophos]